MNTSRLSVAPTIPLVLLLVLSLLLSGPALARSSASASASASPSPGTVQYSDAGTLEVGDIPPVLSENVTDGTGEVNDSLTSPQSVPPAGAAEDLTSLPETGGVPLATLGAGLMLIAGAICVRRMFR